MNLAPSGAGRSAAEERRPRRSVPLPPEVLLMTRLLSGPRSLHEGPVGRCTKRGWVRVAVDDGEGRDGPATAVRYELTEAGRRAIGPEPRGGAEPAP